MLNEGGLGVVRVITRCDNLVMVPSVVLVALKKKKGVDFFQDFVLFCRISCCCISPDEDSDRKSLKRLKLPVVSVSNF